MAITRWDPFTALARFDREFDELVRRGWNVGNGRTGFVPPVEIVREGRDVVVRLELPGIDVDRDVEVTVDKGKLIVRGERRDERAEDHNGVLVRELRYGSFQREFALPDGMTADHVEAAYDQGMLMVRVRDAVIPEPEPQQIRINRTGENKSIDAS